MATETKILIVDDDETLRESLKEQFSLHEEFHVSEAATATQGIKALKSEIKIWGVEPETAAPAALSFEKGSPQVFENFKQSFVDGAGGQSVFPRMWERMKPVVDGYIVVSLEETKKAMRLMAEKTRIISEGAGALPVAAALTGKAGKGPIVAIVSGGNIDMKKFCELIGACAAR